MSGPRADDARPVRFGGTPGGTGDAPKSVAVLADVHGNLPALEAVVRDISRLEPDRVIVNGDMVNRGPDGVAVMERLETLGWPMTLGNHDHLMRLWADQDPSLPEGWYEAPIWRGTGWCAAALDHAGWLPRLANLPMTVRVEPDGAQRMLVAHGSPRHYREGYGEHLTDAAISEITQMHPADVLVGSHTHRPLERRWGRHLVLNSGSVGSPFNGDPRAQYLMLRLEEGRWRPEFRRVPYDRRAALAAFEDSGYAAEGGLSAHVFWIEAATARSFLVPFLMWAEENARAADEEAWAAFRAQHGGRFAAPDEAGNEVLTRLGYREAPPDS